MIGPMRERHPLSALRWISIFLLFGGLILFTLQLVRYSRLWANFPIGLTIGGIPVGGLDRQGAADRLAQAYTSLPVELHYGIGEEEAVILLDPRRVGFELDTDRMLAAAELERTRQPFWQAFWNYLWGRSGVQVNVPLSWKYSEDRLRQFLVDEVSARYDHSPLPAMPVVGTVNFKAGTPGTALDVDAAIPLIRSALQSSDRRAVALPLKTTRPSRPPFQNLEVLLRQTIRLAGFDGLIGLYMADLQSGQEIHFMSNAGQDVSRPPEVAFTASSTIKIPIMISAYRRLGSEPDSEVAKNLEDMIARSINEASDWVMETVIDPTHGPLKVTEDMQLLGFESTFLAGFFAPGSPLLFQYQTPANSRPDITTDPDPYSQTTPAEVGMLLMDIYQCAQNGGGSLAAAFPGEITQSECQLMIDTLVKDHMGQLIQGGVPDGTRVAHKHGWVTDAFYVIHDMSDAAIVFTPGGNYVLVVFLYHPTQLVFEPNDTLIRDISRAVYNFYNLPAE
jgi:beta-lactamase class A